MDTYLAVPVGVIDLWIHTLLCLLGLQTCGYIPCCACWDCRPVDTYLAVPVGVIDPVDTYLAVPVGVIDLWIHTLLCLLGPPWKLGL